MSGSEARAWWADVQEVRETIERRRAAEAARPPLRAVGDAGDRPAPGEGGRARDAATPAPPPVERRTVHITGRPGARATTRLVEVERRRPARSAAERVGARPERLALWAVALCVFLILVAATSAAHA
ncbi:MAG TPA: hypothetical protein VN751_09520 [Solirubrobacteraceae bacterium]|nr:hypothetical protein [Solirubrobacteraceae bacterium]